MTVDKTGIFDFPILSIDKENVSESWLEWATEFELALEMRVILYGKEIVNVINDEGEQVEISVNKFTEECRLLALLKSIGKEGRHILQAFGFNRNDISADFDKAWKLLNSHYVREDNLYAKTHKFCTVRQFSGEDDMAYLLRVEGLSRQLDFLTEEIRKKFTLVLAVNGYGDANFRKELMCIENLDWDLLTNTLRSRSAANHASDVLSKLSNNDNVSRKYNNTSTSSFKDEAANVIIEPVVRDVQKISNQIDNDSQVKKIYYKDNIRQWGNSSNSDEYQDSRSRGADSDNSCYSSERGDHRNHSLVSEVRAHNQQPLTIKRKVGPDVGCSSNWNRHRVIAICCFICDNVGHISRFCPDVKCYNCLRSGHISTDCKYQVTCHKCLGEGHIGRYCSGRKDNGNPNNLEDRKGSLSPSRSDGKRHVRFKKSSVIINSKYDG